MIIEGRGRVSRGFGPLMGGLTLIGLGLLFLCGNVTGYYLHNWWALFILIPALSSLSQAYDHYSAAGEQFTPAATRPLMVGSIMLLVAITFLLELNMSLMGPLFLVAIGATLLLAPSYHSR
jgi:hypothetical protein